MTNDPSLYLQPQPNISVTLEEASPVEKKIILEMLYISRTSYFQEIRSFFDWNWALRELEILWKTFWNSNCPYFPFLCFIMWVFHDFSKNCTEFNEDWCIDFYTVFIRVMFEKLYPSFLFCLYWSVI